MPQHGKSHRLHVAVWANEPQLFSALSEALNNQVRLVNSEKKELIDEAKSVITTIREMETSLDDSKSRRDYDPDDITITYPLNKCLQTLKEKHTQISRLHRERFEQVKSRCLIPYTADVPANTCRTRPSTRVILVASRAYVCPDRTAAHWPQSVHPHQL